MHYELLMRKRFSIYHVYVYHILVTFVVQEVYLKLVYIYAFNLCTVFDVYK